MIGSCTLYTLCSLGNFFFFEISLFLSADENIDIGAI